jgi:type III secretion protein D
MSENDGSDQVVLKVLSGLHHGAEMVLHPGKYHVGSAEENEISLRDPSLSQDHFLIEVGQSEVSIMAKHPLWIDNQRMQEDSILGIRSNSKITIGGLQFAVVIPERMDRTFRCDTNPAADNRNVKPTQKYKELVRVPIRQKLSRSAYFVFGAILVSALGAMATSTPSSYSPATVQNVSKLTNELASLQENELQLGSKGDAIVLSGYVSNKKQQEKISRAISESKLPKVYSHYHVVDEIQQRISEFISEPGIKVKYAGNGLFVLSGQAYSKHYRDNVRRLENDLRQIARIEHGESIVNTPKASSTQLSIAISGVRMTPVPHFIAADGSRFFVGGRTPDGREVVDISNEKIVFNTQGRIAIYQLASNQLRTEDNNESK